MKFVISLSSHYKLCENEKKKRHSDPAPTRHAAVHHLLQMRYHLKAMKATPHPTPALLQAPSIALEERIALATGLALGYLARIYVASGGTAKTPTGTNRPMSRAKPWTSLPASNDEYRCDTSTPMYSHHFVDISTPKARQG